MESKRIVPGVWLGIAAAALVIGLILTPILSRTLACIGAYSDGTPGRGEVIALQETGVSVLIGDASQDEVTTCFVPRGDLPGHELAVGDLLEVVAHVSQPERCTTAGTLEAAEALVNALFAVLACFGLFLILVGLHIQRTLTQVPEPTTRLEVAPERSVCPRCAKPMSEGYLPLTAGLHWREADQPIGVTNALGGLPGTSVWRGRPRVQALRCEPCEVILLGYGKSES